MNDIATRILAEYQNMLTNELKSRPACAYIKSMMNSGWEETPTKKSLEHNAPTKTFEGVCNEPVFNIVSTRVAFAIIVIKVGMISNAIITFVLTLAPSFWVGCNVFVKMQISIDVLFKAIIEWQQNPCEV